MSKNRFAGGRVSSGRASSPSRVRRGSRWLMLTAAPVAVALVGTSASIAAVTDTWTGTTSTNWGTSGNWTTTNGGGIPLTGDTLVLSANANTLTNDLTAGISLGGITFGTGA